jgi:hypothetical protein
VSSFACPFVVVAGPACLVQVPGHFGVTAVDSVGVVTGSDAGIGVA